MSASSPSQLSPGEREADVAEAAGVGLRVLELGLVILAALLVTPPLLVFAVVVVVPTAAVLAVIAAVVAVVVTPVALVRRVRAHHRVHGSTLLLHRMSWRAVARAPISASELPSRLLR